MTLDSMVQDASTGLFVPAQARRQVIPYDDLQALNPSTQNPQISSNLISTLAVLVGQGPTKPRLVQTDDQGRVKSITNISSITTLTAALPALATTAIVKDSSAFYVGQVVTIAANDGSGNTCTDVFVKRIPDGNTIQFVATCGTVGFAIGDYIVGGSDVRVTNVLAPVQIGDVITMLPPGSPNPGDQSIGGVGTIAGHKRMMVDPIRSCDVITNALDVQPAANVLVIPAQGVGVAIVLNWAMVGGSNNTGAAQAFNIDIWDGPSGTGTRKTRIKQAFAVGQVVSQYVTGLNIRGSGNTQMTIAYNAGAANMFQDIAAGAFLEGV